MRVGTSDGLGEPKTLPKMNKACNKSKAAIVTQSGDERVAQSNRSPAEAARAAGARKKHPSAKPIKPAANISQPKTEAPNITGVVCLAVTDAHREEGVSSSPRISVLVLADKLISQINLHLMLTHRSVTTFVTL